MHPSLKLSSAALVGALALMPLAAHAAPITVLFVGNSFTHGKYDPVRTYNAGFGTGSGNVHDQNCLTLATCSAAELPITPAPATPETGPYGGIPGIFLQFTKEAGLSYDVSINAVSSATLTGTANSASRVAVIKTNPLNGKPFDAVVLQEQSFSPLPAVNNLGNATRGNFPSFISGTNTLVNNILAADTAASRSPAKIILYSSQPLASYLYQSPLIQGSSTGGLNQPYVGDPIETLAADLHAAYAADAAQNKAITSVAYAGDAWITAIQRGDALRNPYLATQPAGQVDLWDSDVAAACCTTPIGYHPSTYGAYLNALVLFETITGLNPTTLGPNETAAAALGITPAQAVALQQDAMLSVPEPSSLLLLIPALLAFGVRATRPHPLSQPRAKSVRMESFERMNLL